MNPLSLRKSRGRPAGRRQRTTRTTRYKREINKLSMRLNRVQNNLIKSANRNGFNTDGSIYSLEVFKKYAKELEEINNSFNNTICTICKEKDFTRKSDVGDTCSRCKKLEGKYTTQSGNQIIHKFGKSNNMDPGDQPNQLKNLTLIEQLLIAQVHPVLCVFRLKGGQYGYRGQVVNLPQNLDSFTTNLPRALNSLSSILIIQREFKNEVREFRVNKKRVFDALNWLKNNNKYYKDININMQNLDDIEDGDINVLDKLQKTESVENNNSKEDVDENEIGMHPGVFDPNLQKILNEDDPDGNLFYTDAVEIPIVDNKELVDNVLDPKQNKNINAPKLQWPTVVNKPINEYTSEYMSRAFPHLYCTGDADLNAPRQIKVTAHEYFKHLMYYHDDRFATDERFRFFAMNSELRWISRQNATFAVKKKHLDKLSIDQLVKRLKEEPDFYKNIMVFNSKLRSTSAYWYLRSRELIDMVNQLGCPTLFITLSAADLHWPEIFKKIDPNFDYDKEDEKVAFRRKMKIIQKNPKIFAKFFSRKYYSFFTGPLTKYFKIKDFWLRVEFQHRGSPHIHGIVWLDGAKDLTKLSKDADQTLINEYKKYYDTLITAVNPNSNLTHKKHPSTKTYNDVGDEEHLNDYTELLNCVQRHTKCTNYCLRTVKKVQKCKFNFPFKLREESILKFDEEKNAWQYIPKRNDPLLNCHNRMVIELWRANIDIQVITDINVVIRYIAKYASKNEVRSKAFIDFFRDIAANKISVENETTRSVIQKAMIKMVNERDYCAQETMYYLLGLEYYHCSRPFVVLNLPSDETFLEVDINPKTKYIDARDNVHNDCVKKYCERPENCEEMTIKQFYSEMKNIGKKWVKRKAGNQAIVRIFPNPEIQSSEIKAKLKCIVNYKFRSLDEFKKDQKDFTWQQILEKLKSQNNSHNSSIDIKEDDIIKAINDDENQYDLPNEDRILNEDDHYDDNQNQWMNITRVPHTKNIPEFDLGQRDFDLDNKWNQEEDENKIKNMEIFFDEIKKSESGKPHSEYEMPNVVWNSEQQDVINLFNQQISDVENNIKSNDLIKRVVIQGKAGSGKSTLIKYMTAILNQKFGPNSFLLAAPTGVAAVNINGSTFHSKLKINPSFSFKELTGQSLNSLQAELSSCKFVIIDEFSMIGLKSLMQIDSRCKQAKKNKEEYFGGMYIYLLGDIKQLPAIRESALYKQEIFSKEYDGKIIYASFKKFFILKTSQRQADEKFRNILDSLADAELTFEQYETLMTRRESILNSKEVEEFRDSIKLFSLNSEVREYNEAKLKESNLPVCIIKAKNQNIKQEEERYHGLENTLKLVTGARVMLRRNLLTEQGLVNGSLGFVREIVYRKEHKPPNDQPAYVMIKFDNYNGPNVDGLVPIAPVTSTWIENETCKRTQLPLTLAWACTIHKSQGLTLDRAQVDVGASEMALGLAYVALSRVKTLEGLLILNSYSYERFEKIKKSNLLPDRKEEENRMLQISKGSDFFPPKIKIVINKKSNNRSTKNKNTNEKENEKIKNDENKISDDKLIKSPPKKRIKKDSGNEKQHVKNYSNANDYYVNNYVNQNKNLNERCPAIPNTIELFSNQIEEFCEVMLKQNGLASKIGIINSNEYLATDQTFFYSIKNYCKNKYSSTYEKIFVPINFTNHWVAGFIDIKNKRILIIDPLYPYSNNVHLRHYQRLFNILKLLCLFDTRDIRAEEFSICKTLDRPTQPKDSLDCGVYISFYLFVLIKKDLSIFDKTSEYKRFIMNSTIEEYSNSIVQNDQYDHERIINLQNFDQTEFQQVLNLEDQHLNVDNFEAINFTLKFVNDVAN
jgi:energy-coupling factor transporter ATP-binding protein EcfA2